MDLEQKKILVLGLGESGLAMARWCASRKAVVTVADTRDAPPLAGALAASATNATLVCGAPDPALVDDCELICISPGLSPLHEPQRTLLARAAVRGVPVVGEIELFAWALEALHGSVGYQPRVIAVTGTNGKTTVASLTAAMCRRAGKRTALAGNISPAALDALFDAELHGTLPDVWVLEWSSFQLHGTSSFVASAAALLNLSEDHLDWHGSMAEYTRDKTRIFAPTTVRVINRDDAAVVTAVAGLPKARTISFGLSAPIEHDSFGVLEGGGARWLAVARSVDEVIPAPRRPRAPLALALVVDRLMPLDALKIRGDHNAANALAALALCHAIGLPLAPLLHALREYKGEPHRVESVASLEGVEYFDDSKGTNVGATVAALSGLGRPVVLIAGGDGKGQDFAPLATAIGRHARALLLIGRDAGRIREALDAAGSRIEILDCATLEGAVVKAAHLARPGDAVLLSPACASFDMFSDYLHRARVFRNAVAALVREETASC